MVPWFIITPTQATLRLLIRRLQQNGGAEDSYFCIAGLSLGSWMRMSGSWGTRKKFPLNAWKAEDRDVWIEACSVEDGNLLPVCAGCHHIWAALSASGARWDESCYAELLLCLWYSNGRASVMYNAWSMQLLSALHGWALCATPALVSLIW